MLCDKFCVVSISGEPVELTGTDCKTNIKGFGGLDLGFKVIMVVCCMFLYGLPVGPLPSLSL